MNVYRGVSGDMVVSNCGVQILFWPVGSTVASNRGIINMPYERWLTGSLINMTLLHDSSRIM